MQRLRRYFRLTWEDWRLLLLSLVTLAAVRGALTFLPFRTLRRLQDRLVIHLKPSSRPWRDGSARANRIGWAVRKMSHFVPAASCLTQALAAQVLLASSGLSGRIHIGVARNGKGGFLAHAWVESEGTFVVGQATAGHFTPLAVLERKEL